MFYVTLKSTSSSFKTQSSFIGSPSEDYKDLYGNDPQSRNVGTISQLYIRLPMFKLAPLRFSFEMLEG